MVTVGTVSELSSWRNSDGGEEKRDIWYNRRISFTRFSHLFGRKSEVAGPTPLQCLYSPGMSGEAMFRIEFPDSSRVSQM
jgi:hypothetical protein